MGKSLAERFASARAVFDEVDAALGEHLSHLIFEGPETELTLTANAQPALMAVSMAVVRTLETETGFDLAREAAFVAGHSLGEYSALAAAGALTITDAATLLRLRGNAMQAAVPPREGAMAALIGVEPEQAASIAAEAAGADGICQVANDNGGGQVVVSGTAGAVGRAVALARARGVRRAVMLAVSAPFHCELMRPAADVMAEALARVTIAAPRVPLVANVTARPITAPDEIRLCLIEQVCGTVRWRESMTSMVRHGVTAVVELGSGKVLSGLMKRIAPAVTARAVGSADDVAAFAAGSASGVGTGGNA